ncbi:MAG: hypothetical protein HC793_04320, partial [Aquincola sp.]|nr:hypothetical protein [Aquincola sp.]
MASWFFDVDGSKILRSDEAIAKASFETAVFAESFHDLLRWRRDVRRFRTDAVPH